MSNYTPQFLTAQTVFIDGIGLLGNAKQVALPKVEQLRETFNQGGFEQSVSNGTFKALEAEITLSEYSPSVYASMMLPNTLFVVKGSLKHRDKTKSVVATFKGEIDVDDGTWEAAKETERKIKIYCNFYSLVVDGIPQVTIDTENMIALIGLKDFMADVRSNIL